MDNDRAERLVWAWAAWMESSRPVRGVTSGMRAESSHRDAVYERQEETAVLAVDAAIADLKDGYPILWEAAQAWYLGADWKHAASACEPLARRAVELIAVSLDRRGVA